ncbi:MAG: hypothetical protein AAGI38_01105 [Bacteroidota bacterium]
MKRRKFIQTIGAASAGIFGMPYVLPEGRLFARTNSELAGHVVLVLFAGGVRQQESVGQQYLAGSQNEDVPGNILYNLLAGDPPETKIVYGTDANLEGEVPIRQVLNQPLELQGTFFREMRTSMLGHYGGLNVAIQGNTVLTQGLAQKPVNPTIFEYVRRHRGLKATDVWFIGNGIGNSIPLLTHSTHPDYGAQYAANFFAPSITFGEWGIEHLSQTRAFHPEYEMPPAEKLKAFLDQNYSRSVQSLGGIGNSEEEHHILRSFLEEMYQKTQDNTVSMPTVKDSNDLVTMGYAAEVMRRFTPKLTVINLNDVDLCHTNFTTYLRSLHRSDHAVGFLWDFIQTQIPSMKNDTIMLLLPECGRNMKPNPVQDENDWYGYDHADENAERIFGMMVGPNIPANLKIGGEGNSIGISADMVPTIAEILGIKDKVMAEGMVSGAARSLFDRI